MTTKQLAAGAITCVSKEFFPKATLLEKAVLIGAPIFGFDAEDKLNTYLHSPFLENSKIWKDSAKTAVDVDLLKEFATQMLAAYDGKYVLEGFPIDVGGGATTDLFKGFIIDASVLESLFQCLENEV